MGFVRPRPRPAPHGPSLFILLKLQMDHIVANIVTMGVTVCAEGVNPRAKRAPFAARRPRPAEECGSGKRAKCEVSGAPRSEAGGRASGAERT